MFAIHTGLRVLHSDNMKKTVSSSDPNIRWFTDLRDMLQDNIYESN